MTTEVQGVKQNPDLVVEDLRRLSLTVNELVKITNRGFTEQKVKSISSNYTVDDTFTTLLVSSTAIRTITMIDSSIATDRVYTFIKTDSSTRAMVIKSYSASQTINGSTSVSITAQYGKVQITTDGIKWYKIV